MINTTDILDARGLSCPQPVIIIRGRIKEMDKGTITILVDNETSKENVIRAAENRGWILESVDIDGDDFKIVLRKD
jgi:tRNA 2-thiouridine synthesizing protein A